MTSTRLEPGDSAPDFSLVDQSGATVSLSDFAGSKVIVYFYPAASTPGCTAQACEFRDNLGSLENDGYRIVGISKDELPAIQKFVDEERLTFPMLSDSSLEVHKAYSTWDKKSLYGKLVTGSIRSTFVIDEKGVIEHALYNVKATGHLSMLRKKLKLDAA